MAENKKNIKVVKSDELSKKYEDRFVVVSTDTGEILDDAQGYGYRSKQKAHTAYNYKNRDRSKDKKRKQEEKAIKKWWLEHKELNKLLQRLAVEILKGSWGLDDKLDAKLLKEIMEQNQIESDFSAGKLLRVWRKM